MPDLLARPPVAGAGMIGPMQYRETITLFEVKLDYIERFPIKTVGAQNLHEEYWIPAEYMHEFDINIMGKSEIVSWFTEVLE